jgi:hypothetical protein
MALTAIIRLVNSVKLISTGIQKIKNAHVVEIGGIRYEPIEYVSYTENGMPIRRWKVTYPDGSTWWGFLSKNWKPHGYGEFRDPAGNLRPDGCGGFWDDGQFLGRDPAYEEIAFNKGFLCCYTAYDRWGSRY